MIYQTTATPPAGLWDQMMAIYRDTWPGADREPVSDILFRMKEGEDVAVIATEGGELIGFFWLSSPHHHRWAVLRHMAVAERFRCKGFGSEMVKQAIHLSRRQGASWLFLEARARQQLFYGRLGFKTLPVTYAAPMPSPGEVLPMALMWHGGIEPTAVTIRSLVMDLYLRGYRVAPSDERLNRQIRQLNAREIA